MTIKFETGKTYYLKTSSDGDDHTTRYKIVRRTAKTVWIQNVKVDGSTFDPVFSKRIKVWDGEEVMEPWGSYSMSPVLGAKDVLTDEVNKKQEEYDKNYSGHINEAEKPLAEKYPNMAKAIVKAAKGDWFGAWASYQISTLKANISFDEFKNILEMSDQFKLVQSELLNRGVN